MCESINRLSRNPSVTFRVEEQLADDDVRLWAIDEPFEESFGSIVLRHVNAGLERGYLHELKEKSRARASSPRPSRAGTQGASLCMGTGSQSWSTPTRTRQHRE